MKTLFKIIIIVLLVILSTHLSAQHFQTVWTGNAYQPMSIIVTEATIDIINCEAGDEIAVFDVNDTGEEICVGTSVLTSEIIPGSPLVITASRDDNLTSDFDGFIEGHEIIYKFWDVGDSIEITTITTAYDTTSPFVDLYTSFSTALVALEGFTAVNTTALSDSGCQGEFVIPITVNNILNVAGFNLKLDFNDDDISYSNYQAVHDSLLIGTLSVVPSSNSININWVSTTSTNINNDTLLELIFIGDPVVSQSVNLLIWDTLTTNSYYLNTLADTLTGIFQDGQITIDPEPENAGSINGNTSLCQGSLNGPYVTDTIANTTNYIWELVPMESGTITGGDTLVHVDWSESWSGIASLSVYGSNSCGNGTSSLLYVTIESNPEVDAGVDTSICFDNSYQMDALAINYSSIIWTTSGDGEFDDANILNATYFPGDLDIEGDETVLTITAYPNSPCISNSTDDMILSFNQLPDQPQLPEGPITIDLGFTATSEYYINQVDYATGYQWNLEPEEAGNIVGTDTIGIVYWNSNFVGLSAFIHVSATSACGAVPSDTLGISITPVGIGNLCSMESNIKISPNPSNGRFVIINKKIASNIDLVITNSNGHVIYYGKLGNNTNINIDISSQSSGVYYLRFVGENTIEYKKHIISMF